MTRVPSQYLTPRQAVDRLADAGVEVLEDTVRRWIRKGHVPAIKLPGGQYQIKCTDVDALLAPVAAAE